jgi:hypothetical protein
MSGRIATHRVTRSQGAVQTFAVQQGHAVRRVLTPSWKPVLTVRMALTSMAVSEPHRRLSLVEMVVPDSVIRCSKDACFTSLNALLQSVGVGGEAHLSVPLILAFPVLYRIPRS